MGSFGTLWDAIGLPVGRLLVPFGALWLPLAVLWGPGVLCGPFLEDLQVGVLKSIVRYCSGIAGPELITGIRQIWQIPGIPGLLQFPGNGGINYRSGPPFHARLGSG